MAAEFHLCYKIFARQSELRRHARITHENHIHECGIGHKLFKRQYRLTKHKELHAKVIINSNIG